MNLSPQSIRVLVAQSCNYGIARAGLCRLLESQPGFAVVGEAGSHDDALRVAAKQKPDIVLLDAGECADGAMGLLAALVEATDSCPVVVLTTSGEASSQRRAASLGALGIVHQEQAATVLFKAIERVHAGEIWLERSVAASVLQEKARPRSANPDDPQTCIATLTEREREVIANVCRGLKNQAIADRLFVSEATVRHRLTAIFDKLRLNDRLGLVIFAYQHDLAELSR